MGIGFILINGFFNDKNKGCINIGKSYVFGFYLVVQQQNNGF